jgi:hypothetical protein
MEVLQTIQIIFDNFDISNHVRDFTYVLNDVWEFAGDMRRAAEPKNVYLRVLELAFHPKMLDLASCSNQIGEFPMKVFTLHG